MYDAPNNTYDAPNNSFLGTKNNVSRTKQHACTETYRLGNVEPRQDIPGGNERSQDGGGNLQVGGDIDAHDAHMGEVVQSQQQEEEEPEKLGCTCTSQS